MTRSLGPLARITGQFTGQLPVYGPVTGQFANFAPFCVLNLVLNVTLVLFCEIGKGRWTGAKEAKLKEHLAKLKHEHPTIYEQLGVGKSKDELKEHRDPGQGMKDEEFLDSLYEPTE